MQVWNDPFLHSKRDSIIREFQIFISKSEFQIYDYVFIDWSIA